MCIRDRGICSRRVSLSQRPTLRTFRRHTSCRRLSIAARCQHQLRHRQHHTFLRDRHQTDRERCDEASRQRQRYDDSPSQGTLFRRWQGGRRPAGRLFPTSRRTHRTDEALLRPIDNNISDTYNDYQDIHSHPDSYCLARHIFLPALHTQKKK